MKKIGLSMLTLAFITTTAYAKANKELVQKYMHISGATQTIESISYQVTNGIEQTSAVYGKKTDNKKIQELEKIFSPDESIEVVEKYLVENFDDKELKAIISFYNSSLGQKITEASLEAISPDNESNMMHFIADLRKNPPSKDRVKTISKFIKTLDMDAMVKDIYIEMFSYLSKQGDMKLSKDKSYEFIRRMNSAFEQQVYLSSLYIYRDINNQELRNVMKFYNDKAGKSEKKVIRVAMKQMLKEGFKRAMK